MPLPNFDDVTGVLDFIIEAGRKAKRSGREYFEMMVNDPRIGGIQNVKKIESDFRWTNLERINKATAPLPHGKGLSLEEALKETTAYRYANPHGFSRWESINVKGVRGNYTSVKTVLVR